MSYTAESVLELPKSQTPRLKRVRLQTHQGEAGDFLDLPKAQIEEKRPINIPTPTPTLLVQLDTSTQIHDVEYRPVSSEISEVKTQFRSPLPFAMKEVSESEKIPSSEQEKQRILSILSNPYFIADPINFSLSEVPSAVNNDNHMIALQHIVNGDLTKIHIDRLFREYPPIYLNPEYTKSNVLYNMLLLLGQQQNVSDIDIVGFYFDETRGKVTPESLQRFLRENPNVFDFYSKKEFIVRGAKDSTESSFALEEINNDMPDALMHFAKRIYGSAQTDLAEIMIDILREARNNLLLFPQNNTYTLLSEYADLIIYPDEERVVEGEVGDPEFLKRLNVPNLPTQPLQSQRKWNVIPQKLRHFFSRKKVA